MTLFHFNSTYKTCFFLFLIIIFNILFHLLINENNTENFENKQNLILMGDSVFRNDNYVDSGHSIKDIFNKDLKNVIVVAQDNAVINDIKYQFKKIPKSMNNSNTKLIVSIGGNDLLNYYKSNDVTDKKYINTLFQNYQSNIEYLITNSKYEIVLCNIYYPKAESFKRYHKIISIWNKKVKDFSRKSNLELIELDKIVDQKHYFTNDIEPSFRGGLVIRNHILNED
tara:strand:+ start:189 stop:866 length:678 start_codon:yes stop_codon:yes gene_type:complete